jgi:hypothetical protein
MKKVVTPQLPKLVVEHIYGILDSCKEVFTNHGAKQTNASFDHAKCKNVIEVKGAKHWYVHCECFCHKKTKR